METIQEIENNERKIIRIIQCGKVKTDCIQLDRESIARIKEKNAQRCNHVEAKDNFVIVDLWETPVRKSLVRPREDRR